MHTWTKRGLQTALVTGGLLMLGTGIASAQENVSPDKPANPLDVSVDVPIHAKDNQLATPLGKVNLPDVKHDIKVPSVNDLTGHALEPKSNGDAAQPKSNGDAAQPKAADKAAPAQQAAKNAAGSGQGNKVDANLTVPIELCGNAVGVLADSEVQGSCDQTTKHDQDVDTDGQDAALAGNVVKADGAVPVQVTGNALGVLGHAKSDYQASQHTESTGNITTNGKGSFLGGNAAGLSPAVPVELNGLAGGILGKGEANSQTKNVTKTGGWIDTNGDDSVLGGAGLGGAPAIPVAAQNAALGDATTGSAGKAAGADHVTDVTSGDGNPDASDIPMYVSSSGKHSLLGGTTGAAEPATPVSLCGIAGGAFGKADANCGAENTAKAGGATVTDGTGSAGGGNAAHAPIAFPVNVTGIAGGVVGKGTADSENASDARAGGSVAPVRDRTGNTFTNGNDSFGGANVVSLPVANSADLCAIAGGFLGHGKADCDNTVGGKAGGYDGSLGNNSAGAGNVISTPIAIPAEVLGVAGNGLGSGTANSTEKKELVAGGESNSADDNGFISSNIIHEPATIPAQLMGIAGGGAGKATANSDSETTTTAGGASKAHADKSGLAGNIVTAPLAAPAQLFGLAGEIGGVADGTANNETAANAGGPNRTTGKDGFGAANVVAAPTAPVVQGFGDAVGVIAEATGTGNNDTTTNTGGTTITDGSNSAVSGNAVQAAIDPVVQGFGDAVGVLANDHGDGINNVDQHNGGPVQTDGSNGFVSGNIGTGAGQGLGQLFGNAVSALGKDSADGTSAVNSVNGGDSTTDATGGTISGNVLGTELQPLGRLFGNGVGVAANPVAEGSDSSQLVNGGSHEATGSHGLSGIVGDLPVVLAPSAFGNGVGALGAQVVAAATDDIQGTNSTAEPNGFQLPVGLAPNVHGMRLPILSEVLATGVPNGELVNAGEPVAAPSLSPDALPGADELPTLPAPQSRSQAPSTLPAQMPNGMQVLEDNVANVVSGLGNVANVQAPSLSGLGDAGNGIAVGEPNPTA